MKSYSNKVYKFIVDHQLMIFGSIVSIIYLWIFSPTLFEVISPTTKLKPNELGDFLAGLFAPLAFLWLVLGFLIQASELRLSRRDLYEQMEVQKAVKHEQKRANDVASSQVAPKFRWMQRNTDNTAWIRNTAQHTFTEVTMNFEDSGLVEKAVFGFNDWIGLPFGDTNSPETMILEAKYVDSNNELHTKRYRLDRITEIYREIRD